MISNTTRFQQAIAKFDAQMRKIQTRKCSRASLIPRIALCTAHDGDA